MFSDPSRPGAQVAGRELLADWWNQTPPHSLSNITVSKSQFRAEQSTTVNFLPLRRNGATNRRRQDSCSPALALALTLKTL